MGSCISAAVRLSPDDGTGTLCSQLSMTAKKMCGIPSIIMKNEWLDGIFPQESLKQQAKNRILKKTKRHEIFIIDPHDGEVLEKKEEIRQRNIKFLLEDLLRFYIRKCVYTPLLYIFVMTAVNHFISGVLCLLLSLTLCTVTVLLHYVYRIIYLEEDEEEDEE